MVIDEKIEAKMLEVLEDYTNTADSIEIVEDLKNVLDKVPTRESKVVEFHEAFNQVINFKPIEDSGIPNPSLINMRLLRFRLIFEELAEYAEACGLFPEFYRTVGDILSSGPRDLPVSKTGRFDALLDLQYVLSGTVVSEGFAEVFDKGFDEVHRSNMTKTCKTISEAEDTIDSYIDKNGDELDNYNIDFIDKEGSSEECIVTHNGKALKSINYSPANLGKILDDFSKGNLTSVREA